MKNTVLARGLPGARTERNTRYRPAERTRYTQKTFKQGVSHKLGNFSPRLMLVIFALGFLCLCVIMTWAVSDGHPLFGAQIAGVDENDLFFRMFLADEARANIAGPQGGPAPATLKLFSYTVNKDDSLSRIAEKTGVSLDALISLNKLSDAHIINVGQQLTIPNQKGIYYKVKKGDTIEKLVKDYKIVSTAIQEANGLVRDELETGSVIFLPGAKLSAEEMDKALGMEFVRPALGGWISSVPGYRRDPFTLGHQFHPGIDIALPYGTTIVAARSGQVEFAGWNGGYGRMVMIKHTDGYSSIYGHMQRFIVSGGQWVRAGQVIGYVGSTGYSTGPHLHFELRRYGQFINPMQVPGFRRAFSR